ncbi:MAG: hypothetical protein CK604_07160 [Curvibacter sp. PD_MW3]|nr:MAG: hypothetical protein CK604_07160 [Curvibacter sp. PD_MW3]
MFIGGTLQGTPQEMARQAAPFRAARPDIKAPVMHYSLSLQAGDGRKTTEEWKPMVEAFLQKMGVPLDAAWTAYLHDDTTMQHCHLAYLRSLGDGQVWNREFSAKRAIQATAEIEKEFGLLTHDRTPKREKKRQAVEEKKFEKLLKKEGKTMSKEHIKRAIDEFIESRQGQGYTIEELRSGLVLAGVDVVLTERGGAVAGVKFSHEGNWISGSGLGDGYKAQGLLERGLKHSFAPAPGKTETAEYGESSPRARSIAKHNTAAASLGELLAQSLLLPIEAIKALVRALIRMINMLLGRKEVTHGAPTQSLGRFNEMTGRFQPGRIPNVGEPGHAGALAAMAAAEGDLNTLAEHVETGSWSKLLEYGPAPYQHKEGAKESFFARLRLADGKETEVWGVDIQRALSEIDAHRGDLVTLERAGRQQVTIQERTAEGKQVEKQVHRNAWTAEKADNPSAASATVSSADAEKHSSDALRDRDTMREITIRWLRDRADYIGKQFGSNGVEHQNVFKQLDRLGFGPADEVKYQTWRATDAIQRDEGYDDFIHRRELEYLDERLGYAKKYPAGRDKEIEQIQQRINELEQMQIERDERRQKERQS